MVDFGEARPRFSDETAMEWRVCKNTWNETLSLAWNITLDIRAALEQDCKKHGRRCRPVTPELSEGEVGKCRTPIWNWDDPDPKRFELIVPPEHMDEFLSNPNWNVYEGRPR